MHVKRQTIKKSWPVPRKGTKYIVRASHNKKSGLPLLIILRDLLKIAKNRGEARKILQQGDVSVNGKTARKEELSVGIFDLIKIGNKNYEIVYSNKGKFALRETEKKENVLKVINKKILKNKKVQLNLIDGRNIISNEKVKIGDSIVLDNGKIIKILPVKEGREILIFAGKYKGKRGKIEKIEGDIATIVCENEKINVPVKKIIVME